jgi:hypothetical protein
LLTYESILNAHKAKYNIFEPIAASTSANSIHPSNINKDNNETIHNENVSKHNKPNIPLPDPLYVSTTFNIYNLSSSVQPNLLLFSPSNKTNSFNKNSTYSKSLSTAFSKNFKIAKFFLELDQNIKNDTLKSKIKYLNQDSISEKNFDASLSSKVAYIKRATSQLTKQEIIKNLNESAKSILEESKFRKKLFTSLNKNSNTNAKDDACKFGRNNYESEANTIQDNQKCSRKLALSSSNSNNLKPNDSEKGNKHSLKKNLPLSNHQRSKSSCFEEFYLKNDTFEMNNVGKYYQNHSTTVKKLAENILLNNSKTSHLETRVSDKTMTCDMVLSNELNEQDNSTKENNLYVPIGTVKRQVESINFKSKPCCLELLNDSEGKCADSSGNNNDANQVSNNSTNQAQNTSPDSKRFKIEQVENKTDQVHDLENEDSAAILNRQSEFNRSKKVFENLQVNLSENSNKASSASAFSISSTSSSYSS